MKTIQNGDWWNNVAIKTSVILADFKNEMERNRQAGIKPSQYVYNAPARLQLMRAYRRADI